MAFVVVYLYYIKIFFPFMGLNKVYFLVDQHCLNKNCSATLPVRSKKEYVLCLAIEVRLLTHMGTQ
jgi:hypothetical protein